MQSVIAMIGMVALAASSAGAAPRPHVVPVVATAASAIVAEAPSLDQPTPQPDMPKAAGRRPAPVATAIMAPRSLWIPLGCARVGSRMIC